jgi:hypothetical protein
MSPTQTSVSFLLILSVLISTTKSEQPIPTPAPGRTFALPLTDQTTGRAMFLPIDETTAYLVYTTETGIIGLWTMTTSTTPPEPPTPPTPPTPSPKLAIAVVENATETTQPQKQVLAAQAWRTKAESHHKFYGILPSTLVDRTTGRAAPHLQPFLDAAKPFDLPRLIMFHLDGTLYETYPIPPTPEALEALIPNPKEQTIDRPTHHTQRLAPTP